MSRNLCTDRCESCNYRLLLSDIQGKPVEFRKYGPYPPQMGVRFDCQCGKVYFVWYQRVDKYWGNPEDAYKDHYTRPDGTTYPNKEKGRFVHKTQSWQGKERVEDTGFFRLDLSYYQTFNDEDSETEGEPWYQMLGEDEDTRLENS